MREQLGQQPTVVTVAAARAGGVVDADALLGQQFLGAQWPDLADRADESRLAGPEPAGDQDLDGDRQVVVVRVTEAH